MSAVGTGLPKRNVRIHGASEGDGVAREFGDSNSAGTLSRQRSKGEQGFRSDPGLPENIGSRAPGGGADAVIGETLAAPRLDLAPALDVAIEIKRRDFVTLAARRAYDQPRGVLGPIMKKLLLLAFVIVACEPMAQDAQCVSERAAMIETIRAYARSEASLLGAQGISESILEAMRQTGRHRFIPGASCSVAYADRPVFIGQDQTISQPFIVALMTHFAELKLDHTVLEVGTGSGYQAAILARLVRKVCTVEIIPSLGEAATQLLRNLGYENVSVKVVDGYHGWQECGPFDAIIVTAALEHVPPPLIEQLRVGGRLVMPLGSAQAIQQLTVAEKIAEGKMKTRAVMLVRFVPFTRSPD
jgi:protein-L-isoaspartate(D-aspartate) O-methyltransferase